MKCKFKLVSFFLLLFTTLQVFSQGPIGGESDRIDGTFKFIPIPYVDYDNSYGYTIGVLPLGMFNLSKKDTISPHQLLVY